jgi:hypothetical protein
MPAAQAQTVELPKRLPLITQPSNRNSKFQKDSRLVNAFAERDQIDGGYTIEKRVGLSAQVYETVPDGRGMYFWNVGVTDQKVAVVSGTNLYFIIAGLGPHGGGLHIVLLGSAPQLQGGRVRFQPFQASPPLLVFGAGQGITYYTDGNTITAITDPNFPATAVPGIVCLDGTGYVMDNKGIIYSTTNLNDPTAWNPLGNLPANAEPDGGIVLAKQLVYVVAIKQWTTEFFYDAGNPIGNPLGLVQGALLNYGCVDAETLQELNGVLFWVTQQNSGSGNPTSPQVIRLENLSPKIVSTPAIDRLLAQNNTGWESFAFQFAGHSYYGLTMLGVNLTLVYDIGQNLWYQWTDANGNYWPVVSLATDMAGNYLVQNLTSGGITYLGDDDTYPSDSGEICPVDIYTPNFDADVNRSKSLYQMWIDGDQQAGSYLLLRVSDDDYQTWSNFRRFDLSIKRPYITDCGSFERRAFHFRHPVATPFRVENVDLSMDLGTL